MATALLSFIKVRYIEHQEQVNVRRAIEDLSFAA